MQNRKPPLKMKHNKDAVTLLDAMLALWEAHKADSLSPDKNEERDIDVTILGKDKLNLIEIPIRPCSNSKQIHKKFEKLFEEIAPKSGIKFDQAYRSQLGFMPAANQYSMRVTLPSKPDEFFASARSRIADEVIKASVPLEHVCMQRIPVNSVKAIISLFEQVLEDKSHYTIVDSQDKQRLTLPMGGNSSVEVLAFKDVLLALRDACFTSGRGELSIQENSAGITFGAADVLEAIHTLKAFMADDDNKTSLEHALNKKDPDASKRVAVQAIFSRVLSIER